MKALAIKSIRRDGGTQSRARLDAFVIEEYQEAYRSKVELPPVVVFYDGTDYWLADGFYRTTAAENVKMKEIACEIRQGTQRDAILDSVGANTTHGVRRTNEDKRRAVMKLLDDVQWAKWSDREIARRCSVGHAFVSNLRPICPQKTDAPEQRTVQRNGATYQQNTSRIGRAPIYIEREKVPYVPVVERVSVPVTKEEEHKEIEQVDEADSSEGEVEAIMDCIKATIDRLGSVAEIRTVLNSVRDKLNNWVAQLQQ